MRLHIHRFYTGISSLLQYSLSSCYITSEATLSFKDYLTIINIFSCQKVLEISQPLETSCEYEVAKKMQRTRCVRARMRAREAGMATANFLAHSCQPTLLHPWPPGLGCAVFQQTATNLHKWAVKIEDTAQDRYSRLKIVSPNQHPQRLWGLLQQLIPPERQHVAPSPLALPAERTNSLRQPD